MVYVQNMDECTNFWLHCNIFYCQDITLWNKKKWKALLCGDGMAFTPWYYLEFGEITSCLFWLCQKCECISNSRDGEFSTRKPAVHWRGSTDTWSTTWDFWSGTHVSGPKDGIAPPAVMIGNEFGRKSVAKATVIYHPLALKWERSCRYYSAESQLSAVRKLSTKRSRRTCTMCKCSWTVLSTTLE